jgi:putative ABC transport system permease protein
VLAAGLAEVISRLLAPVFPLDVAIPATASVALPIVAVVVGLLAALAGLRRTVSVDPAYAFGAA